MIKDALASLQNELIEFSNGITRQIVLDQVAAMETELVTQLRPNDATIATAINELAEQVPDGRLTIKSAFETPILTIFLGENSRLILDLL